MNNNDDMDAEVIGMVNRGHNQRLPRATVTFIPAERAARVLALDERIQTLRSIAVPAGLAAMALLGFVLGQII